MGAVVLLAAMGVARAEGPDIITVRQTAFDLNAGTFALVKQIVTEKGDVKLLENPGKALARWASVIPTMFPKGTETGGNTKALPEIWSDSAGFTKDAEAFGSASTKLAADAKAGDAEAVAADYKLVGESCGACHKAYRAK